MEVATTTNANNNNHGSSHSHHFLQHHRQQQRMPHHSQNSLSVGLISETVAGAGGARSPFQREVREWQRIDPDTGALLSGRLEADRWINGPMNSYGKISDSQNISQPNGTQHTQRKQLEVLQARTANGAMQVIRAHTVQTTSSRWSSATSSASSSAVPSPTIAMGALTNGQNIHSNNIINNSFHNSSQLFQFHQHNNNMKHNHFQSPSFGRLDLSVASPPPLISTLEISEVNNDDSSIDGHNGNSGRCNSQSHSSQSSSRSGSDLEDIDDDSNCDVVQHHCSHHHPDHHPHHHQRLKVDSGGSNDFFNRHSFQNKSHNNITNHNLSLLMETLETAPSLKLSNLMKSNSSLSSNNSSSNNSTTTINSNTHQRGGSLNANAAGKISLHAIVCGSGGGCGEKQIKRTSAASSSSSTLSSTATATNSQQKQRSSRFFEQDTLFGNSNLRPSLTKPRVGVSADETCAAVVGDANAADDNDDGDGRLKRNGNVTPTQLKSRQQRRDLESFRHYNEHGSETATPLNTVAAVDCHNDDDDILRLTARHQRRQQIPATATATTATTVHIQRSRSISTDNLSNDRNKKADSFDEDDLEPSEWKRVSKLRRSFQSSNSSRSDISVQPRRPIDLPTNSSVSVAKIRAELENGRRLNTAMRNNHVDLAALDSILNSSTDESSKPVPAKRNSFLTAESLKEIRAGLKKLSDESLYRDDYVTATQAVPDEHIEIQDIKKPPERIRPQQSTPENVIESSDPKSAFQVFTRQAPINSYVINSPKHTTHSLESRQKHRDSATSIDWHLRRKSYGFEKMSPPDDKAMCRMDASTDSGLGRSGEQLGNWSPTHTNASNTTHATVIQFGTPVRNELNVGSAIIKPTIQKRYRPLKSPDKNETESELKRHSIAVDESQYMRKTSQVRLNGLDHKTAEYSFKSMQPTRFPDSLELSSSYTRSNTQQKRVEFCKTEVHFAAESGRVNIVETDGKPPPTNNFRRRRRTTSGPLQTLIKSTGTVSSENPTSQAVTLFGDTHDHKVLAQTSVAYRASLIEAKTDTDANTGTNVTFSTPKGTSLDALGHSERSRSSSSYASTSGIDTTDCETDEISAIRGILKNKPIKPKPYHLGENIDSADALWGVQLRPVGSAQRPEHFSGPLVTSSTVAERIRLSEEHQDGENNVSHASSFSTKINVSLGHENNAEQHEGAVSEFINGGRRASAQELMLQDLRAHQRILDEGLKSTSLILKTMRSANEFDEAMRRLSIASLEAAIIPPIVIPTPMLRSQSYQETSGRISITSLKTTTSSSLTTLRRLSTEIDHNTKAPTASPRLKLFGNTEIPVNQQLTHLRRLYDLASGSGASQDEDSADEEVKRLFNSQHKHQQQESSDSGGGTQGSSSLEDERLTEYSSSWSRLKAKRTIWRIGSSESSNVTRTLDRADLPRSNVMSIELHSPHMPLESQDGTKLKESTPPIAKPRTVISAKTLESSPVHTASVVKQTTDQNFSKESKRDFLKIVKEARGARKLREHELSYFGVPAPSKNSETESNPTFTTVTKFSKSKRNLPQRKSSDYPQTELISDLAKQQMTTKWQLLNDKPDLLRHSPLAIETHAYKTTKDIKPTERESLSSKSSYRDLENDDHIYENIATAIKPIFKIKSPVRIKSPGYVEHSYDRKTDLKRDAMILSEMTQSADQTMKSISDDAAIKDQRRRSASQRRHTKPLETIDEKINVEKINDNCIAVQVSRSATAKDVKLVARQSTPTRTTVSSRARSSSQSSNDSCPRARSRSLSSEREYETFKMRQKRTSQSATRSRASKHAVPTTTVPSRSSSRESAHGRFCSSSDEREQNIKRVIRSVRSSKPTTSNRINNDSSKISSKDLNQHHLHAEKLKRCDDVHSKKRIPSSTAHSSRRERVECNDEAKTHKPSHQTQHKSHESISAHHSRKSGDTSSSRKQREEQYKSTSSSQRPSLCDKRERDRLRRSDHLQHQQPSESNHHRSSRQRTEREKEREKSSRSKGHSSRSSQQQRTERSLSSKTREHKKAVQPDNSETNKIYESLKSTTYSKNSPLINGHHHHKEFLNSGHNEHEHIHKLTTATIAAKQREHRSGKDRK